MTIIEKEIARREALIAEKADKQTMVTELQAEIEKLNSEIASVDEESLRSEIAELAEYLVKPEEQAEEIATTPNFLI